MGFITLKGNYKLTASNRRRLFTSLILGATSLILTVVLLIIDPVVMLSKYKLRLAEGTFMHKFLTSEIETVEISIHVFNFTNIDKFLSGTDHKLKVHEVGPFTYRELRTNKDIEFDTKAAVIRYSPNTGCYFVPEKSIAYPEDVNITLPNPAIMAMSSLLSSYNIWIKMGFELLIKNIKSETILTTTVHKILWDYEEPLIKMGNTILPGLINFDKLGLLDRLFDKKNNYRLEVGTTNADKFMIKRYKGERGLLAWGYGDPEKRSKCNTFVDAYEGMGFPPGLTPQTPIRLFRDTLCRLIDVDFYEERVSKYGIDAYVYKISNRTYNRNPDNECTCTSGTCVDGMFDVSPCFYGLPLAISNAHFLYADQSYFEKIEGLKPDEEKHGSEIFVEPKLGTVLSTRFSMQANIVIRNLTNPAIKRFSNMVLPVGQVRVELPDYPEEAKANLKLVYFTAPKVVLGVRILLTITSLVFFTYSSWLIYWIWLYSDNRGIEFQLRTDEKNAMLDVTTTTIITSVDDSLLSYNDGDITDTYS